MTDSLKRSIVRIRNSNQVIVGVGFLVHEGIIFSCAHVIKEALNIQSTDVVLPKDSIYLDFPFSSLKEQIMQAKVICWGDRGNDIAVLKLLNDPPFDSQPSTLERNFEIDSLKNLDVEVFGCPRNYDKGIWTNTYKVINNRSDDLVQLDGEKSRGKPIEGGFSGAPVWNERDKKVIGMIVTADQKTENKIAFMLPIQKLIEFYPKVKESFDNKTYIDVPIVIAAMTKNEADNSIEDSDKLKELFLIEDIQQWKDQHYKDKRDEWHPNINSDKSMKVLINEIITDINKSNKESSTPLIKHRFVSDNFFNYEDKYKSSEISDEMVSTGGIIVIDTISLLLCEGIRNIISFHEILRNENVAVLGVAPLNKRANEVHCQIEQLIFDSFIHFFNRTANKFDELCEFGINNIVSIERWLFNVLKKTALKKSGKNPYPIQSNINGFTRSCKRDPGKIDLIVLRGGVRK